MVNFPTILNNLKTKVDHLDIGKLKTVPVDLEIMKIMKFADNEVVKNTKFKALKTKVNNVEKKNPEAANLIHINQYNSDKQNLEKKLETLIKNIRS